MKVRKNCHYYFFSINSIFSDWYFKHLKHIHIFPILVLDLARLDEFS